MKTFFRNMTSSFFTLLAAFALALAPGGAQAQTHNFMIIHDDDAQMLLQSHPLADTTDYMWKYITARRIRNQRAASIA